MSVIPAIAGFLVALGVGLFATATRLDRDRAFYPTVLIVIASYYVLFAVIGGGSPLLLGYEITSLLIFAGLAVLGFSNSLWLVVAGLAAHGVFDFVRPSLLANPGVPTWWPPWCLAYDVAAACYLAWLLARDHRWQTLYR